MENNFTTGTGHSVPIPPLPFVEFLPSLRRQLGFSSAEIENYERLVGVGVPPLIRTEVLALSLGISHKLLFAMALYPERYYRTFYITKRSGGKRQIDAPRVFLKTVQKWILHYVLYTRLLPAFVTGFVPGRNLLTNARAHVGQKFLIKIDLKDFFPSVAARKIEETFEAFGYGGKVVSLLARLCTFRGGLPQGAPTSPYLANLGFIACDEKLNEFANRANLRYTRYADDLTFSRNEAIPDNVSVEIADIIRGFGFQINPEKSRSWRPGQRLITTGMVVNEAAHPTRQFRRRLRAIFHQASINPQKFRADVNRLIGWAAFANMYDRKVGGDYLRIARQLKPQART